MNLEERMSIGGVLRNMNQLGWAPGAILDIGVAMGTEGLYGVWEDAPLVLVDPVPANLQYMEQIRDSRANTQVFNVGASNSDGRKTAKVFDANGHAAIGAVSAKNGWRMDEFEVRRIDTIVKEAKVDGPFLYKLDTDAHEAEILEGSKKTLKHTEVCIIEGTVFNGLKNKFSVNDLYEVMHQHGFAFFDIAGSGFNHLKIRRNVDFVFVKEASELFRVAFEKSAKNKAKIERRIEQRKNALVHNPFIK